MKAKTLVSACIGGWVLLCPLEAQAQVDQMTTSELHQRLVSVMDAAVHRPVPEGDTLVTWSPNPVLYTTVERSAGSVRSSLIRADGMVGTAETSWDGSRPGRTLVSWTRPDSVLVDVQIDFAESVLVVNGTHTGRYPVPDGPWCVADYGMEDQLTPLIGSLPIGVSRVSVFRPYGMKWDLLVLDVRRHDAGTTVLRREDAPDSPTFRWDFTREGALIRITRDDHDSERRPLEGSSLQGAYRRLIGSPGT